MLLDFVGKLSWHSCFWEPSSKVSSNYKSYKSLAHKTQSNEGYFGDLKIQDLMIVTVFAVKRHREEAMFFSATILIKSSTSRSM